MVSIDNIKDVIITYQRRFIATVDFIRSYLTLRDLSVVLVCLYPVARFSFKNRHKAQRKAKFYINKCRSASCMQSRWKRTPA